MFFLLIQCIHLLSCFLRLFPFIHLQGCWSPIEVFEGLVPNRNRFFDYVVQEVLVMRGDHDGLGECGKERFQP